MRKLQLAAVAFAISLMHSPAEAVWFTRADESGQLVITGVAEAADSNFQAVYVTCMRGQLTFTISTSLVTTDGDVRDYQDPKVIFTYKNRSGEKISVGADGKPTALPGNLLAIEASLTHDISMPLWASIIRGDELDIRLVHPELSLDVAEKKIYGLGSFEVNTAATKFCPEMKSL